ncbi:MAG: hypothetical protein AB7N80_03260 [Bdellovibrionales bacterium]
MEKLNLRRSDWGRILFLLLLSFLYLSPGGGLLLEGRRDRVMSDGSDPATLPYNYSLMIEHFRHAPGNLLFGAIPTDRLNPPEGFAIWLPWIEKVAVSLTSPFIPVEQASTFFVFVLFAMTGISFYLMARVLGWSQGLSLALSICWAFSAYTRARAKVHMALAGVYHLPLVVLGLYLAVQGRSRKSLALAALCLLLSVTVAHYYIIILAFVAPFFVAYVLLMPETKAEPKRILQRTITASLPAVLLIGWSYYKPLPSAWIKPDTITHIKTGETDGGERHPFLTRFATHPVDYFTGELATGPNDVNPVRGWLTAQAHSHLGESNQHERTNGIRWLIWLAFAAAIWALTENTRKQMWSATERKTIWLFIAFSGFCMWLSFAPDALPIPGPSAWLYALMSQFRVPSRAGVFANFGILMVAGFFLHAWLDRSGTVTAKAKGKKEKTSSATTNVLWPKLKNKLILGGVLPLLALIELPPLLNELPVSRIVPQRQDLADGKDCGYGMYYPYVSGTWGLLEYYYFLQSMRGSQCKIINSATDTVSDRNRRLMQIMPLHEKYLHFIQQNPTAAKAQLAHLAQCLPMDWIVFDPKVAKSFMTQVCNELGFEQTSSDTCRSRERARPVHQAPEFCLK